MKFEMVAEVASDENFKKFINILNGKLPTSENECKEQGIALEEVEYVIQRLDDFISAFPCNYSKSHIILKLSEIAILFGLVNTFNGEDKDFSCDDFPYTAEYAEKSFHCLKILIREFKHLESSHKRHFIVNVLMICATHNRKYLWSDEASINLSAEVLEKLLESTKHETLSSLLCDDSFYHTIFKEILKRMRPSLMKDTWMLNPSSCHIFFWFLTNVKHPHLVDYLGDIFPPLFMFVSYFGVPQQVLGIQCIDHILENVPPTLMKLDGKEDVIYHSLYPLIYTKELDIVRVLYPCILKLPMMMVHKTKLVYWSEYDKVFYQLLFNMEMESNLKLKRLFLTHILAFVEAIPPFKHLKRLMKILKSSLTDSVSTDVECHITSLKILRAIIKSCWPRMEYYCFQILVLICELNGSEHSPPSEVYNLCEECIILLKHSCCEKFQALTESYIAEDSKLPGVDLLKSALSKDMDK